MFFRKDGAYLKGHSVFSNGPCVSQLRFGDLAKLKTLGFALFIANSSGISGFFLNREKVWCLNDACATYGNQPFNNQLS